MDFLTSLSEGGQFAIQIVIVLICLFYGAKKGGIALGLLGGIGILMLVFAFHIKAWKTSHRCYAYDFSGSGCECNFASKWRFGCRASNSRKNFKTQSCF
ncbi:FUR family transcriptional regulator [Campylobacter jejuni subsp. doylei]|nr:FUR family transcriptional regulator [Campylobacter jejuni subsp. doylei]